MQKNIVLLLTLLTILAGTVGCRNPKTVRMESEYSLYLYSNSLSGLYDDNTTPLLNMQILATETKEEITNEKTKTVTVRYELRALCSIFVRSSGVTLKRSISDLVSFAFSAFSFLFSVSMMLLSENGFYRGAGLARLRLRSAAVPSYHKCETGNKSVIPSAGEICSVPSSFPHTAKRQRV